MPKSDFSPQDFSDFIQKIVVESGISHNKLAGRMGIAHASVSNWVNNIDEKSFNPSVKNLSKFANDLEVDLWYLILAIQYNLPLPKIQESQSQLYQLANANERDLDLLAESLGDDPDDIISKAQISIANIQARINKRRRK